MTGMGRRFRNARLVGRDRELAELVDAALRVDRDRPVILVTGEAGIGKTRLLSEFVGRLDEASSDTAGRPFVVRGSCLRLSAVDLPFAPILEILDGLQGRATGEALDSLRDHLAGAGAGAKGVGSAQSRTIRFIEIHQVLVAAAGDAPLAVVIDDLHWADQSTLDLLLFLARRLRGSRIVLVAAYRSDELHRRHPLRPVAAELRRGFVREAIDLAPLDGKAVAEQIAELSTATEPDVARAIMDRAEGNPFYVEELVALQSGRGSLPVSIRDVELARLAVLDPVTVRVLGACAVIGRDVDEDLLGDLLELDGLSIAEALRTSVDHSILTPAPDGRRYRFRHALLEEAVHDDLLAGERVDLHRRAAAALQGRLDGPSASPGALARHFDLGGLNGPAIDAYLDAASLAFRALAWTEGIGAFERAAQLVAEMHGSAHLDPRLHDLVVPVARAMDWSGSSGRAIALLRDWVDRIGASGDPAALARLWATLATVYNGSGRDAESRAATATAAGLHTAGTDSVLGVELLLALLGDAWIPGRLREALRLADEAVVGAERLSAYEALFEALVQRAAVSIELGHVQRGLADIERAGRLQAEHGWLDNDGLLAVNGVVALTEAGELERALALATDGLRMSAALGVQPWWDAWILPGIALASFFSGAWQEADGPLTAARAFGIPGQATVYNETVTALIAAGRGDLAVCDQAIAVIDQHAAELIGEWHGSIALVRAARADAAGDPYGRLEQAELGLRALEGLDTVFVRARLATEAASGAADFVGVVPRRRRAARVDDVRERGRAAADLARDLDEGRLIPGTASVALTRANVALAEAEVARADGNDDPTRWRSIRDAFSVLGMRPRVAYAAFRGAVAALERGHRAEADPLLREAHDLAGAIGMRVLARRVDAVAAAARLNLAPAVERTAPAPRTPANPWGLSAREEEVLALLAQGRTNGEIGAALYISTKTASVHVTHILDKLGVSSRTEAALLASNTRRPMLPGP